MAIYNRYAKLDINNQRGKVDRRALEEVCSTSTSDEYSKEGHLFWRGENSKKGGQDRPSGYAHSDSSSKDCCEERNSLALLEGPPKSPWLSCEVVTPEGSFKQSSSRAFKKVESHSLISDGPKRDGTHAPSIKYGPESLTDNTLVLQIDLDNGSLVGNLGGSSHENGDDRNSDTSKRVTRVERVGIKYSGGVQIGP